MKKITMQEWIKIIEKREINVPLFFMPIFDENDEAWVMEGTTEEYEDAKNYFEKLYKMP